jgi:hypothetical protein
MCPNAGCATSINGTLKGLLKLRRSGAGHERVNELSAEPSASELDALVREEKRLTAVESHSEAWADSISAGIEPEISGRGGACHRLLGIPAQQWRGRCTVASGPHARKSHRRRLRTSAVAALGRLHTSTNRVCSDPIEGSRGRRAIHDAGKHESRETLQKIAGGAGPVGWRSASLRHVALWVQPPEIQYDLTKLPEPVQNACATGFVEAAKSGDLESAASVARFRRRADAAGARRHRVAIRSPSSRSLPATKRGQEILAILEEVLGRLRPSRCRHAGRPLCLAVFLRRAAGQADGAAARRTVQDHHRRRLRRHEGLRRLYLLPRRHHARGALASSSSRFFIAGD